MVFSSIEFLFFFLPAAVAAYLISPNSIRNYILLAASLVFYTWGGGALVLILLTSIILNYLFGLLVERGARRPDGRRLLVFGIALSVVSNLAILGWFKYANFAVDQINTLRFFFDLEPRPWADIVLPIGISFYTFQSMSYVIDIARKEAKALRNPLDFALYVSMFPQLVAGPIVRYHLVADALRHRVTRWDDFVEGAQRFGLGLVKKVIIADSVGQIAQAVFETPAQDLTTPAAWVGVIAYTLQIYFDFSAYSDMAIGLGRIFGFRFPENFNRPYSSMTVTDFWRRWHMTLSNWFRDYVYIPLGGNRRGAARTYVNLWIVFLLTGIWHGAAWTFLIWGAYHGALLVMERLLGWREVTPSIWRRALTLFLVMMGWVIFRADSFSQATGVYTALFAFDFSAIPFAITESLTTKNVLILILASVVFILPGNFTGRALLKQGGRLSDGFAGAIMLGGVPVSLLWVISGAFSAFIYFRF